MSFDFERYLAGKREMVRMKSRGQDILSTHCIDPTCKDFDRPDHKRMWIYVSKSNAFCFRCGRAFNPTDTVMLFEGLSLREAEEFLREYTGDSATVALSDVLHKVRKATWGEALPEKKAKKRAQERVQLPPSFTTYAREGKLPRYVKERGLTKETLAKYGIGWCTKGRYANRIVVPVYHQGVLSGWIARLMTSKVPAGVKKVVNPPGVNMSALLFNYDEARKHKTIVLTEGVWDAMAVGAKAVALFGTNLSQEQLALLLKARPKRVVVLFDPDAHDKAVRLADKLAIHFEVSAPVIDHDPDELSPTALAKALRAGAPSLIERLSFMYTDTP